MGPKIRQKTDGRGGGHRAQKRAQKLAQKVADLNNADLVEKARQEPRDPITVGAVTRAVHSLSRTGRGLDHWAPTELLQLPQLALASLCVLLNMIELAMSWPLQVIQNLIIFLPKPDGGERPITLTCMLYAVWCQIRGQSLLNWDQGRAHLWDTAVAGSQPLQAPMRRRFSEELAHLDG